MLGEILGFIIVIGIVAIITVSIALILKKWEAQK